MSNFKIFVVDDDLYFSQMIGYHLQLNPDHELFFFENGSDCLSSLSQKPDIICLDFGLPDINGDELFNRIRQEMPTVPIIVISGQEDVGIAIKFLKEGAIDYIVKNEHTKDLLLSSVAREKENTYLKNELIKLRDELASSYNFNKTIIGESNLLKSVFFKIKKAVETNINVSITGETGTGKELVAKAIHYNSGRKRQPFIAVNMGAIPRELLESEFFGYEKGAFTGANSRTPGKFELANHGTIFLDEISELDTNLQIKLLRVIQEREVIRLGGNHSVKLDIRVIAGTNKNLIDEVKRGAFRADLYYRLVGLPIELPPLRDRGRDVLILANHFIKLFSKENKIHAPVLTLEAQKKLMSYHFPGNIRELKSIIELACVMTEDGEIKADDINCLNFEDGFDFFSSKGKTLKQYINEIITYHLKENKSDVLKTAKILDIGKSTIYNLINKGEVKQF